VTISDDEVEACSLLEFAESKPLVLYRRGHEKLLEEVGLCVVLVVKQIVRVAVVDVLP